MSTFTKEQLIARINQVTAINKYRISRGPSADGLAMDNELFAIALASLEAEPVAYVDPFAFNNFSVYRAGETDNKCMGREWMWANPDAGLIPVYTAPPAPVSVPDEMTMQKALSAIDRLSWQECTRDAYMLGWNACRADMLQSFGNSEQLNSPVIPDGWVACSERMPDKLIPVMVMYADGEMWSAIWTGTKWDDGTELPDPHAVTHWQEMPAAPQQEVK